MKKFFLIFIIIFSLIGFVGCTQKDDTKSQFIKDFDIDIEEKDIELKEEFNDYGGFPYEGMALYKITLDEDAAEEFAKWESLPFSKKAGDFLTSVSTYIELPTIEDGYWKLVDRNPGTKMYTNVSFCVYDAENKIGSDDLKNMSDTIYNILLVAGIIIAIIVGLIMGIKFIIGGIEEKAEIKAMLIPYIIGCVVVFGAFAIWKAVVDILQSM